MEHCVPTHQCDDRVTWSQKTTSVSRISGEPEETLGEVSLKLNASSRSISYRGDVLGGAGSLCPALVGNPALRQQQAALFSDWFPNGDGLSTIHCEEMLGPDRKPILLRLLLTDSGHYLLPVDGKDNHAVPEATHNKVALLTNQIISQSKQLWPQEPPQLRHCFLVEAKNEAGTDRSGVSPGKLTASANQENTGPTQKLFPVPQLDDKPFPLATEHSPQLDDKPFSLATEHSPQLDDKPFALATEQPSQQDNDEVHQPQHGRLSQPIHKNEDTWTIHGQWLIRKHRMPRRTMFTPHCAKSCPVLLEKLLHMLKIEIDNHDHEHDDSNIHYEDDWRNPARAHADLGKPWAGRTMFLIQDDLESYWLSKKQLDSWMPNYAGDVFPFQDHQKLRELHHEYKAMPEEFYVKTGRRVVTPDNVDQWLDEVQKAHSHPACHFLELYSGSGRLSLSMATAGLTVGPPIDLCYGWNINCNQRQKKLWRVIAVLKPEVIFTSPRCKFCSTTTNTMNEEKKLPGRLEDEPGLNFTKKVFQHQAYSGCSYAAEQPWVPPCSGTAHSNLKRFQVAATNNVATSVCLEHVKNFNNQFKRLLPHFFPISNGRGPQSDAVATMESLTLNCKVRSMASIGRHWLRCILEPCVMKCARMSSATSTTTTAFECQLGPKVCTVSGIVTFTSANVVNLADKHPLEGNTASFQENAVMLVIQLQTASDQRSILAHHPTQLLIGKRMQRNRVWKMEVGVSKTIRA